MNDTQKKKVIYQLETRGFVSRNWCVYHQSRYDGGITRLADIVYRLKKEGWILEKRKADVGFGKNDYCYFKEPQKTLL